MWDEHAWLVVFRAEGREERAITVSATDRGEAARLATVELEATANELELCGNLDVRPV
jgi:hypothetical protein